MANGQLSEPLSSANVTANKLGELMLSHNEPSISKNQKQYSPVNLGLFDDL
jgi:hypothetical protein